MLMPIRRNRTAGVAVTSVVRARGIWGDAVSST